MPCDQTPRVILGDSGSTPFTATWAHTNGSDAAMSAYVTLTDLPKDSPLHSLRQDRDFPDFYAVTSNLPPRKAADIITDFPPWAKFLLLLRRIATSPFGLKNDGPEGVAAIGIFPVESETSTEVIAGFDDKHLNFRVSVRSDAGRVSLATWVAPHNWAGRAYLAMIMPFHIVIARNALARVAQHG